MPRFKREITKERRSEPRISASKVLPPALARLASGQKVELVNVSLNGAILISGSTMLSPGSTIRLKIEIPVAPLSLEGQVRRCRVTGVKMAKIQYEAAIILNEECCQPLFQRMKPQKTAGGESRQNLPPKAMLPEMELPCPARLFILSNSSAYLCQR